MNRRSNISWSIAGACALLIISGSALAGDSQGSDEERFDNAGPERRAIQSAGMRARIDPETGELMPYRPAEVPAARLSDRMRNALSRSDEGLTPVTLPDGSVRVDLQGRFQHLQAARLNDGHELDAVCVDHFRHLADFMGHSKRVVDSEVQQ